MWPGNDMWGSWLDWMQTPRTGINLERSAGRHRAHDVLTIFLVLRARVTSRIEGSGRALPFARTMMTTHGPHCAPRGDREDNAERRALCQ